MPRHCTVCDHAEKEAINQALVAGSESLRDIALRRRVSKDAVARHKADHLPATMIKAREAAEVVHANSLLDQVENLRDKALSILTRAETAGDLRTALQGVKEARGCLEFMAKMEGELKAEAGQQQNNFLVLFLEASRSGKLERILSQLGITGDEDD